MSERWITICSLALLLAATALLPPVVGLRVDYGWLLEHYLVVLIPASTLPWIAWRKLDAIRPAVEVTTIVMAMILPILVLTYTAMRLNAPLADTLLIQMDRALGLDWPAFVRWVDGSAIASKVLEYTYLSFVFQILLLPLLLCAFSLPGRAYRLASCYALLVIISSAIAIFFPSVAAYQGYGLDPATLVNIDGSNGHLFLRSFHGVRNDPSFVLGLQTATGILTFPSVHVGAAVLFVWSAWPSRILRWPSLLLNLSMTIGAITHGAHYFVDIIAGMLVAIVTVLLSGWIREWRPHDLLPEKQQRTNGKEGRANFRVLKTEGPGGDR